MPTLRTRNSKGSALTYTEADNNFTRPVVQKTAAYTTTLADNRNIIECSHATIAFTITLGDAATLTAAETGDYEVTIVNINAATVTVERGGTDTINGDTSSIILEQNESVTLKVVSAGNGWQTVSRVGSVGVFNADTGSTVGNLTLADGSITDSSGAISFGNENLSTTGTLNAGGTTTGDLTVGGTGNLQVGENDTTRGLLYLYGDGIGSSNGGRVLFYTAADHDATVDYWDMTATTDDLLIQEPDSTDWMRFNKGADEIQFGKEVQVDQGFLTVGVADSTRGVIRAQGPGAGNSNGGAIRVSTGSDYDTQVSYWEILASFDDMLIQESDGTDWMRFNKGFNTIQIEKSIDLTGNLDVSGQIDVGTNIVCNDSVETKVIMDADTKRLLLGGGSNASTTNGAYISIEGDDYGGANLGGDIALVVGDNTDSRVLSTGPLHFSGSEDEIRWNSGNGVIEYQTSMFIRPQGGSGITITSGGDVDVYGGTLSVGSPSLGNSQINFHDDANNAERSIRWNDTTSQFEFEDSSGSFNAISSGEITQETAQTTTGARTFTFSGIPATAKRITVMFDGINVTTGNVTAYLRIGDSGGIETSGYSGGYSYISKSGSADNFDYTNYIPLSHFVLQLSDTLSGVVTLTNLTGNTWIYEGQVWQIDNDNTLGDTTNFITGRKTLSGTLTQIILEGDQDTWNSGTVNISYE